PESVNLEGLTDTHELSRGIFDVAVYETTLNLSGTFGALDLSKDGVLPEQVQWDKVRLVVGVGDLRGVKAIPSFEVDGKQYTLDEYARERPFDNNLVFSPNIEAQNWEKMSFQISVELRGTSHLQFLQLAKQTGVSVAGNWPSPKFVGQFLPEDRSVLADSFRVKWEIAHFARALPQQWTGSA